MKTPERNALIVYQKFTGITTDALRTVTNPKEIKPENRVLVDGGMYIASCENLELEAAGFLGIIHLSFYEDVTKSVDNPKNEKTLVEMTMGRFFKKIAGKPDIEHEGREYNKKWHACSGERTTWVILNNKPYAEVISGLKANIVKENGLLLSNDFLLYLFSPIIDALRNLHSSFANF